MRPMLTIIILLTVVNLMLSGCAYLVPEQQPDYEETLRYNYHEDKWEYSK
jgi:hypothetical protein